MFKRQEESQASGKTARIGNLRSLSSSPSQSFLQSLGQPLYSLSLGLSFFFYELFLLWMCPMEVTWAVSRKATNLATEPVYSYICAWCLCLNSVSAWVGMELWASGPERRACSRSESGSAQWWLAQGGHTSCNKTDPPRCNSGLEFIASHKVSVT